MKRAAWTAGIAMAFTAGILITGVALGARNSSGTYSLPYSPVVSGTAISSTRQNGLESDIAAELTDSLSRSGKGGMTAPLRVADGTVSLPSFSFTNETGSGLYRNAANDLRLTISGTFRQRWNTTGSLINGTLGLIDTGSANVVTLTAPAALAASYTLTAPAALPGSTLPVTLTSGGVLATSTITAVQTDAVSAATASKLVVRDASGRAAFADPAASGDAATKNYVDGRLVVAARINGLSGTTVQNQVGSISVGTVTHVGTGVWTVAITGLTATSLVIGNIIPGSASTGTGSPNGILQLVPGSNLLTVGAITLAGSVYDVDFAFSVIKL